MLPCNTEARITAGLHCSGLTGGLRVLLGSKAARCMVQATAHENGLLDMTWQRKNQ